jgi:hypothetical protein
VRLRCILRCIHRTNIYLTEEQERALDVRARAEGKTRSALLREILDRELGSSPLDGDIQEAFAVLADGYQRLAGDLFDDDPDLRIDR